MAKNFGKILLGLTAAGAAGAGAYYWLKNRHNEEPEDEFDDTFEEDDFELDDDLGEVPERGYTTLTPSSAKEETSEESGKKTGWIAGSADKGMRYFLCGQSGRGSGDFQQCG